MALAARIAPGIAPGFVCIHREIMNRPHVPRTSSGMDDEQSQKPFNQKPFKGIEISIVVEKPVSVEQSKGRDEATGGIPHHVPSSPQPAVI